MDILVLAPCSWAFSGTVSAATPFRERQSPLLRDMTPEVPRALCIYLIPWSCCSVNQTSSLQIQSLHSLLWLLVKFQNKGAAIETLPEDKSHGLKKIGSKIIRTLALPGLLLLYHVSLFRGRGSTLSVCNLHPSCHYSVGGLLQRLHPFY